MGLVYELITNIQFIAGSIALTCVYVFAILWDRRHSKRKQAEEINVGALVASVAASSPHSPH